MSATDEINKMDFKQLRNEVQLLNDELAIMKRKYEDLLYNLDTENFSGRFIKEQDNMKAEIKVTAEEISTKISETDLTTALSNYSTISQTAEAITSTVTSEFVDSLVGNTYVTGTVLNSQIQQSASEIKQSVSAEYETKDDAEHAYSGLRSEISQTAGKIEGRVVNLETFKESVFTQTEYGFMLDGEQAAFTGVIYLTDSEGNKKFSLFYDNSQGYGQLVIHGIHGDMAPIVVGNMNGGEHNVYLGSNVSTCKAATQGWVENEADIVARFG